MENKPLTKSFILGLSILIGLASLGIFIFKGLKTFSDKDRIVTVKGLAEMNITASKASVTLKYSFSGDNLQEIIKDSDLKKAAIISYLASIGYEKNTIQISNIDISDKEKYYQNEWLGGKEVKTKIDRYTTAQSITIQSKEVKTTEDESSKIKLDLVSKNLTCNVSANYSFPELNSIKPKLIAESTKNARVAGEQFANDSRASLGKIKTASQGQITIAGQYNYNEDGAVNDIEKPKLPYIQKARVVSTIVFFLE